MTAISLITGTAGRIDELKRLGDSLTHQIMTDFEWIIIDQNQDGRLSNVLSDLSNRLTVRILPMDPNLSRALNAGADAARSEILGFPDDDGWYSMQTLQSVYESFQDHPEWEGILCEVTNGHGELATSEYKTKPGRCNQFNAWTATASNGIFIRRSTFQQLGGFDPTLGLGKDVAIANHDLDFILRAIKRGYHIEHVTHIAVMHPQLFGKTASAIRLKSFSYAVGAGRMLRDHHMPAWWIAAALAIPLIKSLFSVLRLRRTDALVYFNSFYGRLRGWLGLGGGRETFAMRMGRKIPKANYTRSKLLPF